MVQVDRGAMMMASAAYLDTLMEEMPEYKRHEIMFWSYEWAKINKKQFKVGDEHEDMYPSLNDLRQALRERE